MKNCPCKKIPCNCSDVPGVTPDGYHTLSNSATGGIVPSAYYPANGVLYPTTNSTIPDQSIKTIPISTGTNAVEAYQALVLLHENPECIKNSPACQSPIGVIIAQVSTTTMTVVWEDTNTGIGYVIKASIPGGAIAFEEEVDSNVNAMLITGLSADTEYEVTVATICEASPQTYCTSVTILASTEGLS